MIKQHILITLFKEIAVIMPRGEIDSNTQGQRTVGSHL